MDPKTGRIVIVGGDGAMDVFESKDQRTYAKSESAKTTSGARTGLLVPERRAFYIAAPKHGSQRAEIREYALPD